ncbi:ABC transporter substrate-binding protein [Paenibacillus sp. J2TS4]|uniref:ABC transporter substrate-binding protein n=1 Tax=Paenibacillus sp. J2TS4 TaxID=2807194 RepID=UPI001B142A71|nr:sugar ABC transporter substrate-binding protein [Paenibacillus sp. J2TS4]GIP33263.1 ABC transporter substrate-binding protein [Paenibacillus sp. J2TS4]
MKKQGAIKLTSAVLLAALATTGCGQASSPDGNASGGSSDKVKLTFWTNARHDADLIQDKIKHFNETNMDNIEVDFQIMTENYEQALQTAIQSDEAPDIFNAKMKLKFDDLVKMNAVQPLDEFLTPELRERFGEDNLKIDRVNYLDGKVYSLPNYGSTFRLIYNKDLFAKAGLTEPPKSLDELVDYAQKITEAGKADGVYGFGINMKNPASAFERSLVPLMRINGDDYYDWKTGKYDFSKVKPYVEAFKKMADSQSILPGYESLDIDPLRNQFASGKIGMYFSLSAEPGVYDSQFPTEIDWAVAQVPTIDGNAPQGANYINGGGNWLYMSAKTKNKEAAWKFMEYMYSDDVLVPYYEQGKGISVIPSVLEKANEPTLKNFNGFAPKDDAIWPAYITHKVEGKAWQNVIAEAILNVIPLDKAIEDLTKQYNTDLDNEEKNGKVERVIIPDFNPRSSIE